MPPKPLVLVILDGWGYSGETAHNAIANAATPVWARLQRDYPHGLINASEKYVGLPSGQMGNSEVGHMNIGSGRVVMQDLPRIDAAIADGSLAKNPALLTVKNRLHKEGGAFHLLGLLSPGGVHSHQEHMAALANIITENADTCVLVHAFLDGRDTPPKSALQYLADFKKALHYPKRVRIATVSGRYYAMDRDKRWDRVQRAYNAITDIGAPRAATAEQAIKNSYAQGITDEFVVPTIIDDYAGMGSDDALIMANFRADRAREILTALLDPGFKEFSRPRFVSSYVTNDKRAFGMTEYSEKLNPFLVTLFPPQPLTNIFGEIVSKSGMKQLRIAETEKYAHVTFFFNGGREEPFPGEERILVPSPKVATYDLKPEMSAYEVTDKLLHAIAADRFDVIIVNYANTDMVGHSGDMNAAMKAVEAVDNCLGRLSKAVLSRGGALVITADHGNAEDMFDEQTHQPHTAHTLNLVPVIIADKQLKGRRINIPEGKLADIAPTLLQLLGLPQPREMTGRSLLAGREE